jgi:hypothetical protein
MGGESNIEEGANAQTKPCTNAEQEGSRTRLETTELFQEKHEDEGKSSRSLLTCCLHAKLQSSPCSSLSGSFLSSEGILHFNSSISIYL